MKKSTIITLVIFAALLAGTVVLVTRKPERGIARVSLTEVNKDTVDRVVMTGKNPVELVKKDGTWKLASGRAADTAAVTRLLEAIPKVKSSDVLTKDAARFAEFEVDAEKGTKVTAYAGKEVVAELTVGKSAGGGLAMRVGDNVFKVPGQSQGTFSKPASSWIERKLFTDKVDEVSRVEIKLAGQAPYALVKEGTAWKVEDPKLLPAGFRFDTDAARALVSSLVGLRAKDFEETDPGAEKTALTDKADVVTFVATPAPPPAEKDGAADKAASAPGAATAATAAAGATSSAAPAPAPAAGSATPAAAAPAASANAGTVSIAPAASAAPVTRVLRLGGTKEGDAKDVYARIEGRDDLFTIPEYAAKSLRKAATDLRDLKLMSFDRAAVEKLAITDGSMSLSFEKKDNVWQIAKASETKPADFELDPGAVDRRISALMSARATRLVDTKSPAEAGVTAPTGKITATLKDGKAVTLAFGKVTKDEDREVSYAQGNADGVVYFVAQWTRTNLLGGLASFKKQPEPAGGGGFENIDPKALSSLPPDVRDSLMKQIEQKKREQELLKQLQNQAQQKGTP